MQTQLRVPAVPLVTIDPYFNVWSMANQLNDDFTRHWTGAKNTMTGIAWIDGTPYQFAGRIEQNISADTGVTIKMAQTKLTVSPLSSTYTFSDSGVMLKVCFTTPLLMDNLEVMSRPASYITFTIQSLDGKPHDIKIYFDIAAEWCVNNTKQKVTWGRKVLSDGNSVLFMGSEEQNILGLSGDDVRIDWGYVNLVANSDHETYMTIRQREIRDEFIRTGKINCEDITGMPAVVMDEYPVLACVTNLGKIGSDPVSNFLILAYDDLESVEYFGKRLPAYWRRNGMTFDEMLVHCLKDYDSLLRECDEFDQQLIKEGIASGGEKYGELLSLAYRQAIAAHKLVEDDNGSILFFSKENFSNGCMGTVDVSYPSIPLFLLYNPELVKGMMRPIFKYANTDQWKFEFAPHDVGRYPKANGQVYGLENGELLLKYQMPVEECGNMLIMMAAACSMEGSAAFAEEHWDLLTRWASYLKNNGLDSENQLCTDDFAGHLANNANLSIKAIIAIGCYSVLCSMLAKNETAREFMQEAGKMAKAWESKAREDEHYKLTFNKSNTWSMKYNLIWDELLGINIFPSKIKKKEVDYYTEKINQYGLPLDSRNTYTKSDWLVWVASLMESKELFIDFITPLWNALNETPSRVPFTDWYDTVTSRQIGFQNRSVVGGIFIKLLKDKIVGRKFN